jgi:hypothetical protein
VLKYRPCTLSTGYVAAESITMTMIGGAGVNLVIGRVFGDGGEEMSWCDSYDELTQSSLI